VLDDVGYGQMSVFGGLVETPTLNRLADQGLRYTNMQTTALCSPTRGCVLGRPGTAVHQHANHSPLLANTRLCVDRTQPPHPRPVGHH
jgi:arylsulfatase A-like enzyme